MGPLITAKQSPVELLLSTAPSPGIAQFLRSTAGHCWLYGSGKVALRDGLAPFVEPGDRVHLPAYVPDAVVEPLYELGLEVSHYSVTETLRPDVADLEARITTDSVALLTVNYFGFPRSPDPAVTELADEFGLLHVDDSAHSPLSVADGRALGTHGDVGFASLHKLFPVPDGACLYVVDGSRASGFEPSEHAGVRATFTRDDATYLLRSGVADAVDRSSRIRAAAESLSGDGGPAPPAARYESSKGQMSKLSAKLLAMVDPQAVRRRRRANYRAWERWLGGHEAVTPVFDRLPSGVCPQTYPVVADDPDGIRADLRECGVVSARQWPRLPETVRADPAYETAVRLADSLVTLPVHQQLHPEAIASACRTL